MYKLYIWDKKSGTYETNDTLFNTKREAKKNLNEIVAIINHVAFNYPQYVEEGDVFYKIEKID